MSEHTEQLNGYLLRIEHDPDVGCPRKENEYQSKMICFHRSYQIGDEHSYKWPDELETVIPEGSIVLPVYLMNHSGLSVSTKPYACQWDSGKVGVIYITPEGIIAEQGDLSERAMEQARKNLEGEVEEYNQYLWGDVYYYVIEKVNVCPCCGTVKNETVDSCGGIYGLEYAKEEGKAALKNFAESETAEAVTL